MGSSNVLMLVAATAAAVAAISGASGHAHARTTDYENHPSIRLFREYLRIDTSQPTEGAVNYTPAVEFWQRQAESIGLRANVYEYYSGKPIVVITWEGSDPSLPSVMLNSHMDVVNAEEPDWKYPPFDAYMDETGDIYGRGTQDMKCVGIWYLEAIRQLMADNVRLARTIHMTLMPEEEVGGGEGMEAFIETKEFEAMNVGCALDEGIAWDNSSYVLMYAERTPWPVVYTCKGPGGHGSTIPTDTAAAKLRNVVDSALNYRDSQVAILRSNPYTDLGTLTSINLTGANGGTASNIIPEVFTAMFDIRLAVGIDHHTFNQSLYSWADGCSVEFIRQDPVSPATVLDNTNPYWVAFKSATDAMGMEILPIIAPGSTDERFVRTKNISGFGFAPMPNTPSLLHAVNERLNAQTFLDGIPIYCNLIKSLASSY